MDSEIKLTITGLVYNQTVVGTYGLVLSEENGNRRFSVMIGEPEAQSIALKMNNKKSPRPLTHDLINSILNAFEAILQKVVIYDMINDVFYSELHIMKEDNTPVIIDARTSDAVALAVRSECPIFIKSEILDIVGTEVEPVEPEETKTVLPENEEDLTDEELDLLSVDTLEEMLNLALSGEKYELAVTIRDAIKRKNKIK
ncbi:MAG: bifunctional nuclease family protein [Bacteroidota bacterium]|nr:bifunctional nuclease family protein [Bacteroidota bacterium]